MTKEMRKTVAKYVASMFAGYAAVGVVAVSIFVLVFGGGHNVASTAGQSQAGNNLPGAFNQIDPATGLPIAQNGTTVSAPESVTADTSTVSGSSSGADQSQLSQPTQFNAEVAAFNVVQLTSEGRLIGYYAGATRDFGAPVTAITYDSEQHGYVILAENGNMQYSRTPSYSAQRECGLHLQTHYETGISENYIDLVPVEQGYILITDQGGLTYVGDAEVFDGGDLALQKVYATDFDGDYLVDAQGERIVASERFVPFLNEPAVAADITSVGLDGVNPGLVIAAADGGVFAVNSQFAGSMGGVQLNQPIVAIAADPSGLGYKLVAADGGVFAFGNAQFNGSMGGVPLNQPIVGFVPSGRTGDSLVAADGGVFNFGTTNFFGSLGGIPLPYPIVDMDVHRDSNGNTDGYILVDSVGTVYAFGAASVLPPQSVSPADVYDAPTFMRGCARGTLLDRRAPNDTY